MISTDNISINKQSSIRIEGEKTVYFDPFGIADSRHDADVIFVTHEHFDHFDPESIGNTAKDDTVLVAPLSVRGKILADSGIAEERTVFMCPGDTKEICGLAVTAVPAYNVLKPFHPKAKKYLGYVLEMDAVRYYVAGDTDVNRDITGIRCDVALVPAGGKYTMDPADAAELVMKIRPQAAIPTHYGSVVGDPGDGGRFASLVRDDGIEVRLIP